MRQISVAVENKKGNMTKITDILTEAGINMNTLVTNDGGEFGIIRMLVSDADRAYEVLTQTGYLCRVDTVLAVEISDDCGSLNALLHVIEEGNININYLYVTYNSFSKLPVAIFHSVDLAEVGDFLVSKGYRLVQAVA